MKKFTHALTAPLAPLAALTLSVLILAAAPFFTPTLFAPALAASMLTAGQAEGDRIIASGGWTKRDAAIRGGWRIVAREDGRYIEFDDQFRTRNAPDLKIFLSPRRLDDITSGNATAGAFHVANLNSNRGAQSYRLPDDLDLSAYQSLLIHCEAYEKLWGGAAIH